MTDAKDTDFDPWADMDPLVDPRTNPTEIDRFQWADGTANTFDAEQDARQREAGSAVRTDVQYYDMSRFAYQAPQPVAVPENEGADRQQGGLRDGLRDERAGDPSGAGFDPARFGELTGGNDPAAGGLDPEVGDGWAFGTDGDDIIIAMQAHQPAGFNGTVQAEDGHDLIVRDRTGDYTFSGGSFGDATINGGNGFDTVYYANLSTGVNVNLDPILPVSSGVATQQSVGGTFGTDLLVDIEGVYGTTHDDTIHGDDNANRLWGHDGDDYLSGKGGHDSLWGGDGDDTVLGGGGDDTIRGNDGDDHLLGGIGSDTIHGDDGNDTIEGGSGADVLYDGIGNDDVSGETGADIIHITDGNDTVHGGGSADEIHIAGFGDNFVNGGVGSDTVFFGNASVDVNLFTGQTWRADGNDVLTSVENVVSGSGNDGIVGSNGANHISSGSGHDYIGGLAGNDTIEAGAGNDEIFGDDGVDFLYGGSGADTIHGGDGDDNIAGGLQSDRITGGAGNDDIATGFGADVLVWNHGDADAAPGQDYVTDFNLAEDTFHFGAGFFADDPGAALIERLFAWDSGTGDSYLMANTASDGWVSIAFLDDVLAGDLNQKILNGSILDVETVFDGPGDWAPLQNDGGMLGAGVGADFIM